MRAPLRIAYAGDRDISSVVLRKILASGVEPLALLVSDNSRGTHASELIELCSFLTPDRVLIGKEFREPEGIAILQELSLDIIFCIHFPYIVPKEVLTIPRVGVLNLHPAFLPYNRGWHTPTWAILEDTPFGATLHFMDEDIDTGDIVLRRQLVVSPGDTADTLYRRVKELEIQVFEEAWSGILAGIFERHPQSRATGSSHRRQDLLATDIQEIDLDTPVTPRTLLKQLRALTTNRVDEAAYFVANGRRYRVQLTITEEHTG